jgi:predicted glutamine amidotransferase
MSNLKRIKKPVIVLTILTVVVLSDDRSNIGLSPVNSEDLKENFIEPLAANNHNCRLWGAISGGFPDSVIYNQLVVYPSSLKNLSRLQNTDGWGLADYLAYGDSANIARGGMRAYDDSLYDNHVAILEAAEPKIVVGHVRFCDAGCCCHECDSIPDPHPFIREKNGLWWTFAHNGNVDKSLLYDLIGEDYLLHNPPTGSGIPECDPSDTSMIVDSELLFIYIMKSIEVNGWDILQGLTEAIVTIFVNQNSATLNFILSDGYRLWAFKKGWSMFYVYDQDLGYSAAASYHPALEIGLWQGMANFELVELQGGVTPVVTDVRDYLPVGFYIPGDSNGSLGFNGLDVTFSVSYLKGLGPAPPDTVDCPGHGLIAAAADANGSCRFNGLDIIYCINFFKGIGSPPTFCPDCPPNTGGLY